MKIPWRRKQGATWKITYFILIYREVKLAETYRIGRSQSFEMIGRAFPS